MSQIPLKLGGKVAVITGGGTGIGAAAAKLFTQLGASITIVALDKPTLEDTFNECQKLNVGQPKPLMFVGNITNHELRKKIIDDTVKAFGKLDILVNNAGTAIIGSLLDEESIEKFDDIMDVNLRSHIVLTQLAAKHLIKTKGSIVNTSSICGRTAAIGSVYYGISKAALDHFTKHAAREFGPHQVRVNSVSPAMIKTNIFATYGMKPEAITQLLDASATLVALGRAGESLEVAQAITFLASDDASFITGTDILVDGGMLVNPIVPPASKE